jgi:hypothetical protein
VQAHVCDTEETVMLRGQHHNHKQLLVGAANLKPTANQIWIDLMLSGNTRA